VSSTDLSQSEKAKGRKILAIFQAFNALSYIILTGNLITLYVIRLGGSGFYVGLTSAIQYVAFFFMFFGKSIIKKTGIRKLMGVCWLLRNLVLIPMVFSPIFVQRGRVDAGLLLVFLSSFAYHVVRGVGIISFNPMIGAIAESKRRGDFLSRLQIVNHSVAIAAGIATALLVGKDAPLSRYILFIIFGILVGIFSSYLVFKLPEAPAETERGSDEKIGASLKRAVKRKSFKRFSLTFFVLSMVHSMVAPFLILYSRELFNQPDQAILIFSVAGNLGATAIGFLTSLLIDRLGAKPLYILFAAFFGFTLIPLVVSLPLAGLGLFIYLNLLFFTNQLAIVGSQITAQNYFFGIITQKEHLNLGIFYNLLSGIGGILGSLLGGIIFDLLTGILPAGGGYRLFFAIPLSIVFLILLVMPKLQEAGSYSIMNALSIIFSPRDLRAVSLLKKLDRSDNLSKEVQLIQEIADSQSPVPVEELLVKLKSPRFEVRNNALRALEKLPLTEETIKSLISEVKNHHYTTAYIAARILGERRVYRARGVLRKALESGDYLLQSKAMVSLAQLEDRESIPMIEDILKNSSNPMVTIHCAQALAILRNFDSIPALLSTLKGEDPPPFLRDETILSVSAILGMEEWFYPFYTDFLEKSKEGISNLIFHLREKAAALGFSGKPLEETLELITRDRRKFGKRMIEIFKEMEESSGRPEALKPFITAAADQDLLRFERFCFLLAGVAVYYFFGAEEDKRIPLWN